MLDLTSGVLSRPLHLDWGERNRANNQKKVRMVMYNFIEYWFWFFTFESHSLQVLMQLWVFDELLRQKRQQWQSISLHIMVAILSPLLQACCRIAEIFYLILTVIVQRTAPCKSIVCHHGGRSGARTGGRAIRISGRRLRSVGVTNVWYQMYQESILRGIFVIFKLNQQLYRKGSTCSTTLPWTSLQA